MDILLHHILYLYLFQATPNLYPCSFSLIMSECLFLKLTEVSESKSHLFPPRGGAMRASGGRSYSRRSAGHSPNRLREPSCRRATVSDRPTTHPVSQRRDARCRDGSGIASRERQRDGTMDIGNWNISSISGKKPELVREAQKYQPDIVGVSSTKLRGARSTRPRSGVEAFLLRRRD